MQITDEFLRLEKTTIPEVGDPLGQQLMDRAKTYFGYELDDVKTYSVITVDKTMSEMAMGLIQDNFVNPVTEISSFEPLLKKAETEFDYVIHAHWGAGVRDNPGATALEDLLDMTPEAQGASVFSSKIYAIKGGVSKEDVEKLAAEMLTNDIVEGFEVYTREEWDDNVGIGRNTPFVTLNKEPQLDVIPLEDLTDEFLQKYSDERNLALHPQDIPIIRAYFHRDDVRAERRELSLSEGPTDIELEQIAQGRSDHCEHNTFKGIFTVIDKDTGEIVIHDNLFKKYIELPTIELAEARGGVPSLLWDNAGVDFFGPDHLYAITGETHNSPSNMEAYGGAITGIVGIYRDPMGTGLGFDMFMGAFGFCTADPEKIYQYQAKLNARRLLDGVIDGVKDGGNKSGIPTPFGNILFNDGYQGKALVFVTALGISEREIDGVPQELKTIHPGDYAIMCGGRVGKDGIHGVTAASEERTEGTPKGHVQIGDPYTQKKMQDFLIEAKKEGLIRFITDNGGGGLSSSCGETARQINSNGTSGLEVDIDKVPTKYDGLDHWEKWVSESQERMTVAVEPSKFDRFMELSKKHAVESTMIGNYNENGAMKITSGGKPIAYIRGELFKEAFPQWKFEGEWSSPEMRGLTEPVLKAPEDLGALLHKMLGRPNICSKEYIHRLYDHEVQGGKVIGPLVGTGENGVPNDMPSDAVVFQPVLGKKTGLVFTQALIPQYYGIDAGHMTAATIDEAVRNVIAVGADLKQLGGVDNFCWPSVQYHPENNPDGKFKAAQLTRTCETMKGACEAYGIPLLSGKDSMYVDGMNTDPETGLQKRISAPGTLQFTVSTPIEDVSKVVTSDAKEAGNLIYMIGTTKDERGGSEYFEMAESIGLNVPKTDYVANMKVYRKVVEATQGGYVKTSKNIKRGGLGVHLAIMAGGGNLGVDIDLSDVRTDKEHANDVIMFSESTGRMLFEVAPHHKAQFERIMGDSAYHIGNFTQQDYQVTGVNGKLAVDEGIMGLKRSFKKPNEDKCYVRGP